MPAGKFSWFFHFTNSETTKRIANINAPTDTPTQKPRKPFPAWRLGKSIKSADESLVEGASESSLWWGRVCAGLVVIGVAAEFVIAAAHPPYDSLWDRWGSSLANFLVAAGILGEVGFAAMAHRFDGELTRRSNTALKEAKDRLSDVEVANGFTLKSLELTQRDLAAANDRLTDANLKLAKVQEKLAPRSLAGKQDAIRDAVRPFAGARAFIGASPSLGESEIFVRALCAPLKEAGWDVMYRPEPPFGPMYPGGVLVSSTPDPIAQITAEALAQALRDVGVLALSAPTWFGGGTAAGDTSVQIFIVVGEKPDPDDAAGIAAAMTRAKAAAEMAKRNE